MVCIVYTGGEPISAALGGRVAKLLEADGRLGGGEVNLHKVAGPLVQEDDLDSQIKSDLFIFLSCHTARWPAFTVHALGNWSDGARDGGAPHELGVSAPRRMACMLRSIRACSNTDVRLTYEATHHGPLLETPSFFVEVGGSEEIGPRHYDVVANAVYKYVTNPQEPQGKVAIGIGGTHYPEKFTKLALEGEYSFSHILPKYYCASVDMLEKAVVRSASKAECAVIDWKGVGPAAQREAIIKRLGEIGLDYVRV